MSSRSNTKRYPEYAEPRRYQEYYEEEYWYGSEAPAYYPEEVPSEKERRRKQNPDRSGRPVRSRTQSGNTELRTADWSRSRESQRGYVPETQRRTRARRRPALMDRALIGFMVVIMAVMSVFLVYYISLQASVTSAVSEIATLESQLSTLKSDNDETLNEINSKINLDDIKYRAIAELGMTYADKDQIINYTNNSGDYVRQVQQVGK